MQTLSYGYKKPQNPDTGDIWFPAMESNMQQLNDHAHNGVDSAFLAVSSQSVLAAAWGSDLGGGRYRQLLTVPTGMTYAGCQIEVRRSTGEVCYPTIERVSSTQFYLYTNDNTLAYTVLYR